MEINSDVRYSALREKNSETESNWQPENEIELTAHKNLSDINLLQLKFKNLDTDPTTAAGGKTGSGVAYCDLRMENVNSSSGKSLISNASNMTSFNVGENDQTINNGMSNNKRPNVEAPSMPNVEYALNANSVLSKIKRKRTSLENLLLSLVVLLVLIIFIMIFVLVNLKQQQDKQQQSDESKKTDNATDYCNSYRCILVSGSMYKSINKKIDPCDDFYEYACGGWIKKNLIPTGFPRWGTLNLITYENQLLIREQLEINKTDSDFTEAELKAQVFYRSCLDTNGVIEKLGAKPLMNILNKFIYKNVTTNRLEINETFPNLLSLIQITYGLNSLFEFNVLDDDKNSSFSNIEIIQGSLGLDRSFYINNSSEKNVKAMEIYKKTIVNIINLLFDKIENAKEEMEELIKFETSLAQIMLPTEKLSEVETLYSRIRIGDLEKIHAPFFGWKNFLNKFLNKYGSTEVLNENDQIILMGLDYFTNLNKLINDYITSGREKTVKLSVIFHLIKFSLPLLSKEYRNQLVELGEALTGSITVERWQTCIEHTDNIFGLGYAITRMFIRASPNKAKVEAQKMIKSIKKSFIDNFPKITWMDNETRQLAQEKVEKVDELIGYPDFIEDDKLLNLRYQELIMDENSYFENEIRLVQYALKSEIVTYRTRVNRAEWEMTSSAVNAYYSPTRNQIVFPSGILQDPFFHPENPMSINYGSIGTIMGHELTHGFDDSGREYDKDGMMHQWWNNKTVENFKAASKCMIDQYSQYKVEEELLNGKQTLGENIADNGGMRAAFYAYERWVQENGEEKRLPLLNLSHKQLFFVSFAQTWCSKSTADSIHLSLSVDQHSPPRFRVIGTVSNSQEFAKAFNCPVNSRMNPAKKCNIW